jgi:hypothetical protein
MPRLAVCQACEDAIAAVGEITASKLSAISDQVDGVLAPMFEELKGKPHYEERQLLQDAHDNQKLKDQASGAGAGCAGGGVVVGLVLIGGASLLRLVQDSCFCGLRFHAQCTSCFCCVGCW